MSFDKKTRISASSLLLRLGLLTLGFGLLSAASCNGKQQPVAPEVEAEAEEALAYNDLGEPIVPIDGVSDCRQSAILLPFTMTVKGDVRDCDNCSKELDIEIHFDEVDMPDPVLELRPSPSTRLDFGALQMTIKVPERAGTVTQKIRISGDSPSVDFVIRSKGDGFAFEMNESFPPKRAVQPLRDVKKRRALPFPIDVAGQPLDEGIELKH